jgi:hypothetical protein
VTTISSFAGTTGHSLLSDFLLAAQVLFRGLKRRVTKHQLNLFQIPAAGSPAPVLGIEEN